VAPSRTISRTIAFPQFMSVVSSFIEKLAASTWSISTVLSILDQLGPDGCILWVLGLFLRIGCFRTTSNGRHNHLLCLDNRMSRSHRVNHSLICRPKNGLVHSDSVATGALLQHKISDGRDGQAAAKDATESWHTRIIPASYSGIDYLGELPLRKERANEVNTDKVPELYGPELQGLEEPLTLGIAVRVLGCAEGMGNAFDAVDDRAGEVTSRIDVPGPPVRW
jgi:hypothetical protein